MDNKKKLDMTGSELVSLACALAITFAEKYEREDLRRLRLFFQSIASNISIIEIEGISRLKKRYIKHFLHNFT